ncbi:RHS repeat domain-containing protein [Stieleria neptunia]|uniref:RHS repeat domain-containing protein n=1 Tax=Stieleria neptunia TaxID=2527979 RepID=UPI0018D2272A|nr:RHS repeat-associated core domain-containing protein [Stieleria neptunia]
MAFRYHGTQQYSVTALTDSSGTIRERYAYDAYGGVSIFDGSGTARTTTAEGNRYTCTGREYDDVLDLYHYRARMYDSIVGRFCSKDPNGFIDGLNLFCAYFVPGGADPSGGTVVAPEPVTPAPASTPSTPSPAPSPRPGPTSTPTGPRGGVGPAAGPTVLIPLMAIGNHAAASQLGRARLDELVMDGKICQELHNTVLLRIEARNARGPVPGPMQRAEIWQILQDAITESGQPPGCANSRACYWHYSGDDLSGRYLARGSHVTNRIYRSGIAAEVATGRSPVNFRCFVCGPKDTNPNAPMLIRHPDTPGGAEDLEVNVPLFKALNCTAMCPK